MSEEAHTNNDSSIDDPGEEYTNHGPASASSDAPPRSGPASPAGGEAGSGGDDGEDHDGAPLVPRRKLGGGMVALEVGVCSGGIMGEDLVLDDDRWRWRHTVSYWVCVSFILGSLLFVLGCAFWYKEYVYESRKRALVTYPFLCGSVCFTVGSYLGLFQAINVGRRGRSRLWEWAPHKDGFNGYFCYLLGALVFNVSCAEPLEAFAEWPPWVRREMAWGAAEVGSACFVAGALLEVLHNGCLDLPAAVRSGRWRTLPFWLSWNNLSGGVLFEVAALAGRWVPTSPGWVYSTYLVGSLNFFVASSMMLYMWKGEQYGLGFISSINRLVPLRAATADALGKGYRRVSVSQFVFLQVYILLTGASFIDFCFATQRFSVYSQYHGFAHFHEAVASLMGVFMALGLLAMASVLHHTPRIHPFDKLLYCAQLYVAVKLIQIIISVAEYYTVALGSDEKEAAAGSALLRMGSAAAHVALAAGDPCHALSRNDTGS